MTLHHVTEHVTLDLNVTSGHNVRYIGLGRVYLDLTWFE